MEIIRTFTGELIRYNERKPKGENEAQLLQPLCHTGPDPIVKGCSRRVMDKEV